MSLGNLKDRFLALPWVYDKLRPLVVGGIDIGAIGCFCGLSERDRVFDLGCGTAQLLPFIRFERYLGVDLDPDALAKAVRRSSPGVVFHRGDDWDQACAELRPSVVLMTGVAHHLPDQDFRAIVKRVLRAAPELDRLVTTDVTYFPGAILNNLFSRMDRGKHVRMQPEYERLFASAGLLVARKAELPTRMRYVRYVGYHLRPKKGA